MIVMISMVYGCGLGKFLPRAGMGCSIVVHSSDAAAIPETDTWAMLLTGLGLASAAVKTAARLIGCAEFCPLNYPPWSFHNHAAPRTPLESPNLGETSFVSIRSENT